MFLPGNFKEAGELQSMGLKRDTPEHTCMHAHTHTHTHTLKILQPQNAINIKHEWATAVSIYFWVVFNIKCSDKLGAWD